MRKRNYSILIMDDDPDILRTLEVVLGYYYTDVDTKQHISALEAALASKSYDLVLLDMNFRKGRNSGHEGLFWLKKIKKRFPETVVVLITAYGEIELAVEAMKHGAADFLLKPWSNDKLLGVIEKVLPHKAIQKDIKASPYLFGSSPTMAELLKSAEKIAATDANVLLLGENGTGKSSLAEWIHQQSKRRHQPFVVADLGALDDQLIASTLFGHLKGAFTDAQKDREGLFQMANGGTLFLDEISNLSLANQAKLLRVLEDRKLRKLGSHEEEDLDIRLITATNAPIAEKVADQQFREDLLFRINTISLTIPPLRERLEDIPLLYQHFMELFSTQYGKEVSTQTGTLKKLQRYHWPGNIRELRNAIERAFILCDNAQISPYDFVLAEVLNDEGLFASYNLVEVEKMLILKAIDAHHGNLSQAAQALGLTRQSLYRRMEKYDL